MVASSIRTAKGVGVEVEAEAESAAAKRSASRVEVPGTSSATVKRGDRGQHKHRGKRRRDGLESRGDRDGDDGPRKGPKGGCFRCGGDHFERLCPEKRTDSGNQQDETRRCYNCNKRGHLARDCPDTDDSKSDGRTSSSYYSSTESRDYSSKESSDYSSADSSNKASIVSSVSSSQASRVDASEVPTKN